MNNNESCFKPRRRLIVTADDFGLDLAVNDAVEKAWRQGSLTAADLMVSAPAASDAIDRAARMNGLGVGLHLVLTDGVPVLPLKEVDLLTDSRGRFQDNMVLAGLRFFFDPRVRHQLAKEIRAQFEAFKHTGLVLDHVSAHKHFHLHPTVLGLMIEIGREYGVKSIRFPLEVNGPSGLTPWLKLMRWRLDKAGIQHNDKIFGLTDSGHINESRMIEYLNQIEEGVTEIYCHPASRLQISETMSDYEHTEELSALLSPKVSAVIKDEGIEMITYRDI